MKIEEVITNDRVTERNIRKQLINVGEVLISENFNLESAPEFLKKRVNEATVNSSRELVLKIYKKIANESSHNLDSIYNSVIKGEHTFNEIIESMSKGLLKSTLEQTMKSGMSKLVGASEGDLNLEYIELNEEIKKTEITKEYLREVMLELVERALDDSIEQGKEVYKEELLKFTEVIIDETEINVERFKELSEDVEPVLILGEAVDEIIEELDTINDYLVKMKD